MLSAFAVPNIRETTITLSDNSVVLRFFIVIYCLLIFSFQKAKIRKKNDMMEQKRARRGKLISVNSCWAFLGGMAERLGCQNEE